MNLLLSKSICIEFSYLENIVSRYGFDYTLVSHTLSLEYTCWVIIFIASFIIIFMLVGKVEHDNELLQL